jgi:ubiquinone/menaquinone biosynthesis C-methylase UbiE
LRFRSVDGVDTTGICFDRAADYYDATRGLPSDAHARVTELLANELTGRGRSVEIGVGTGRIALPLVDQGVDMIGIDLSSMMMARLVEKSGGRLPFPLVAGDATRLPFGERSVAAVMASHVLHLIPPWREAVAEVMRILMPGGVFLVDFGGGPGGPWSAAVAGAARDLGMSHRRRPGISDAGQLAAHLEGRATARELGTVDLMVLRTLAGDLAEIEAQLHSWTWQVTPETLRQLTDRVRGWAVENRVDLEAPVDLLRTIRWWAYDVREEAPTDGTQDPFDGSRRT